MLLAAEFGARVPRVVRSGCQGALALLVVDEVEGTPLRDLEGDVRARGVLDDAWTQTAAIHAAGLAHGRLDADHLVVRDTAVTVVGWERAVTNAHDRQRDDDVAQLLASTAAAAGDTLAIEVALGARRRRPVGRGAPAVAAECPCLGDAVTRSTREATTHSTTCARPPPRRQGRNRPSCASGSGSTLGSC